MKVQPKISADVIAKAFENIAIEVLDAFENFVKRNPDSKWLLVSDYHREKSDAYASDVFVFTVLPAEQSLISLEQVKAGLPCKLSSSKVRADVTEFLKGLNQFTFAFMIDKKLRPFGATQEEMECALDVTIKNMQNWSNAEQCQSSIRPLLSLRSSGKLDSKTFNHAIFAANIAAAIGMLIAKNRRLKVIGWASDRDAIIHNLDRIADTFFNVSLHAFIANRGMKTNFEVCVFGDDKKSHQTPDSPTNEKLPELFYAPYVRIPDHFAAPIAQRDLKAIGAFCSSKQKYQNILAHVVADNPNVAILKLVHVKAGWGFHYVKSSLNPLTEFHAESFLDLNFIIDNH